MEKPKELIEKKDLRAFIDWRIQHLLLELEKIDLINAKNKEKSKKTINVRIKELENFVEVIDKIKQSTKKEYRSYCRLVDFRREKKLEDKKAKERFE